jgi:3',5'-cyclic-AMP phosphodiesterase
MTHSVKPVSILQISDLHVLPHSSDKLLGVATEYYFKLALQHAFDHYKQFDLILVSGDLAQDPCLKSYQRIHDTLIKYRTKTVCLAGNHDDWTLMQQVLNQNNISCDKQLLFENNWLLINLNTQKLTDPGGLLEPPELKFLTHCLSLYPNRHTLIAFHHHCTPSNSTWLDTMQITNSDEFFALLENQPQVKIITTGHIHQALETKHQGIPVLGVPSTCFQFKPKCKDFTLDSIAPGYRVLRLYPNGEFATEIQRLPVALSELHTDSEGY